MKTPEEAAEELIQAKSVIVDEMVGKDGLLIKGHLPEISVVCDFEALRDGITTAILLARREGADAVVRIIEARREDPKVIQTDKQEYRREGYASALMVARSAAEQVGKGV